MRSHRTPQRRAKQLLTGAALIVAAVARADETDGIFLRIDNALFTGTDREYTSGVEVAYTSTTDSIDDARSTLSFRWANGVRRWLQPKGFEESNVTWTIGQRRFTPGDARMPDPRDRPSAGPLLVDHQGS